MLYANKTKNIDFIKLGYNFNYRLQTAQLCTIILSFNYSFQIVFLKYNTRYLRLYPFLKHINTYSQT